MTNTELSWLSLEPSVQDLAWQRFWEEQRHEIINAYALPPDALGEIDSLQRNRRTSCNLFVTMKDCHVHHRIR